MHTFLAALIDPWLPLPLVLAALWIAWGVLWIGASRGVAPVLRRQSRSARALHSLPYLAGLALLAVPRLHGMMLFHRLLPASDEIGRAALVAVALGLGLTLWARRHLAGNWSNEAVLRRGHSLVTTGPYRWVRHPIYSGLLLAVLGSALARGDGRGLIAFLLVLVSLAPQLAAEEKLMSAAFGAAYTTYRAAVPALIPRLLARRLSPRPVR